MVSAEIAFASLAVAAFLYLVVGLCGVVFAQLRCTDAATEIARQTARDDTAAVTRAENALPTGATVWTFEQDGVVQVHIDLTIRPWGRRLPAVTVSADAQTLKER
jgi:hypothetical protein